MRESTPSKIRLDQIVSRDIEVSRSIANKLIKNGSVKVSGEVINKPAQTVNDNQDIHIDTIILKADKNNIHIDVIYEDDDCIVINKPAGILSHAKESLSQEKTVADWLNDYLDTEEYKSRELIVHRLDRETSGVMICAKNKESRDKLQKEFADRKVEKTYIALVEGKLKQEEAIINVPIARSTKQPNIFVPSHSGKSASTQYKVTRTFDGITQVSLWPKTGRTHQLRVHMKHIGCPIVGDYIYNKSSKLKADRMFLHSHSLKINLPRGETRKFMADLPESFNNPKI